jgi:hypothetical protein
MDQLIQVEEAEEVMYPLAVLVYLVLVDLV